MAKGRQLGFGSLMYGMIVFVALWLTSTVLLVILYTNQEGLRTEIARFQRDNAKLIAPAERNAVPLFKQAREGGPTVVGLLEGARKDTAALATGNEMDDAAAVRAKLDDLLRTIRSDGFVSESEAQDYQDVSYHDALTMLYGEFGKNQALLADATDRVAQLEGEVDKLIEGNAQEKNNLDMRAQEISQQLADVEKDHTQYRRERDEQVAALERRNEDHRRQADADLTEERQRSAELDARVVELQQRTQALHEKFSGLMIGPQELGTARQPDGRILTAVPGDGVVYIDRGRNDRLVLGMIFAVYSAGDGIPADGRAKAQIEIVSIDDEAAECKIVAVAPNELILEGDLVANPVYEPNRAVGFLVVGVFDLNHDGVPDADGVATIESLVTEWGGTISAELTALTDFVVLGGAPRRPRPLGDGAPEQTERHNMMQQVYDRYVGTIEAARTLAVPILNQEVFLNFLGYTCR